MGCWRDAVWLIQLKTAVKKEEDGLSSYVYAIQRLCDTATICHTGEPVLFGRPGTALWILE